MNPTACVHFGVIDEDYHFRRYRHMGRMSKTIYKQIQQR